MDQQAKHNMNRHHVRSVVCLACDTEQPPSSTCINCAASFGAYFCSVCNLYDDDLSKQQFHCEKCGICRVGGRDNFFHCDTCGACYSVELRNNHVCVPNSMQRDCPICYEYLFDSLEAPQVRGARTRARARSGRRVCRACGTTRRPPCELLHCLAPQLPSPPPPLPSTPPNHDVCVSLTVPPTARFVVAQVLRCGHTIHRKCLESYSAHGGYTCPLCNASVCDMRAAWLYLDEEIRQTPMPEEYAETRVAMLCNDCHVQGEAAFHALGLKCIACGSYNTRRR